MPIVLSAKTLQCGTWGEGRVAFPYRMPADVVRSADTLPCFKDAPVIVSGLSGNEIFVLAEKGWAPGSIVVGNSVQSLGFVGGLSSGLKTLSGGEIVNLTQLITEGRHAAIKRLEDEAQSHGAHGVTGVTSDLKTLGGMRE